ncbi:hypothetical protein [Halarchaeum sp. P4]|uniref:hypothetical protein n=1 Tax=Halarchaeum sp. P4 TaxID=3421639 RepID=UPI003EBBE90E
MSENDEPTVPVHCEACETTNRVALSDVATAVERHNERVHDGEECAQVDPDVADQLADLVAEDLGLFEE